jgi:uroporphyrinogen-III synthase
MNQALEKLGAVVTPIALYRWELPDDLQPLREAVLRLSQRKVDVVVFTSSIQLERYPNPYTHLRRSRGQSCRTTLSKEL